MEYVVFVTLNTVDGRIYAGMHGTNDPEVFDGYLGCGVWVNQASSFKYPKNPFQCAVKKYGADAFRRITLYRSKDRRDAFGYYSGLVTEDFLSQAGNYNMYLPVEDRTVYQFDRNGRPVNEWRGVSDIMDFYGITMEKLDYAIADGHLLLDSFWSYRKRMTRFNERWRWSEPTWLVSLEGKVLHEFCIRQDCADYLHVGMEDVKAAIRQQRPLNGYYVTNKMTDMFNPKPRRMYLNAVFYVYRNGECLGSFKGKEVMKVINNHSWKKISVIMQHQGGWYKDFFLSEKEVDVIPPKRPCAKIDVYDKYGNFIETMESMGETKAKYKVPACKMKDIQLGDKHFGDYIFKYNTGVIKDIV